MCNYNDDCECHLFAPKTERSEGQVERFVVLRLIKKYEEYIEFLKPSVIRDEMMWPCTEEQMKQGNKIRAELYELKQAI